MECDLFFFPLPVCTPYYTTRMNHFPVICEIDSVTEVNSSSCDRKQSPSSFVYQKSRDDNVASGCGQWVWLIGVMLQVHVVNGCDQWVWSMAVSIGGGFTGKSHHEVSLFLLSCVVFYSLIPTSFFWCEKAWFGS